MILATRILRGACLILAGSWLSACLGSSSGGPGGGSGGGSNDMTPAEFAEEYKRVGNQGPTVDMPISGTASYQGAALTTIRRGEASVGELMGDIDMTVNFADANSVDRQDQAVRGSLSNIRGTLEGDDVSIKGQLTTADAKARDLDSVASIITSTVDIPGIGTNTQRMGALLAHLTGELTTDDQSGPVVVQLGGNFMGSGAKAAVGAVSGSWWDRDGPESYSVDGRFFLDRR